MSLDITEIVDNIVIEGDLNPSEYPVANRIRNINSVYLKYIELGVQIGSKEPLAQPEAVSEVFSILSLASGSHELDRTIIDAPIQRVDFRATGSSKWQRLDEDLTRAIGSFCGCEMDFFASEKQIFVENGRDGEVRVTYARGDIILFTEADYGATSPAVYPTFLPGIFQDILWLEPATIQAEYYKKDRAPSLRNQLTDLQTLFRNHYGRNSAGLSRFDTGDRPNYR